MKRYLAACLILMTGCLDLELKDPNCDHECAETEPEEDPDEDAPDLGDLFPDPEEP